MYAKLVSLAAVLVIAACATAQSAENTESAIVSDAEAAEGFAPLFNGKDLDGWWSSGTNKDAFKAQDGNLVVTGAPDGGYLYAKDEYANFVLRYDYRCVSGEGNSGVGIRCPKAGDPAFAGIEIQVLRPGWETVYQRSCALYHVVAPKVEADKPFGEWNSVEITCDGTRIRTVLNGQELYDIKMEDYAANKLTEEWQKPLTDRPLKGFIGFQDHSDEVWFRNVRIKVLPETPEAAEVLAKAKAAEKG